MTHKFSPPPRNVENEELERWFNDIFFSITEKVGPTRTTGMQNIIQEQQTDYTTYTSGTASLPIDDTIPQSNEGDEFITVSITPTVSTNILIIEGILFVSVVTNDTVSAALFKDVATDALSSSLNYVYTADKFSILPIHHRMVAGATSSTTFKLRAGTPGTNAMYVNGSPTSRIHGGVLTSYLKVTEIKP